MNDSNNFKIIDRKIYDPYGEEFIIKGANVFASDGVTNVDNYLNIWGFNTIRVPNYLLGNPGEPHPVNDNYANNHAIVDAYTSQGGVVIFDAHDRIGGYYEGTDLDILKDYWRDMAIEFKDNPNVWFNLHNEPGNATANPTQWVNYHQELIDIIRSEGAENTIVVDGEAWGQDYHTQTIVNNASSLMNENNGNIVFSIHVYEQWNSDNSSDPNYIGNYLDALEQNNIPIIIGEYGSENNEKSTLTATSAMFQETQNREIGRIVWGTEADDKNDLTTGDGGHAEHFNGSNSEILTPLGQLVYNDNQRVEDLEQLSGYDNSSYQSSYSSGTFRVGDSGIVMFDYLFDGGWFQGELAIFNLEGMEAYTPGSQDFVREAASRALTDTEQGYILMSDRTEGALFDSALPWENDFNNHDYMGQKTFTMTPGDEFAVMLIQHTTVEEIANNPGNMWQWGKLPLFSIPEANPGGVADGQMVGINNNGTYHFEDLRVDWGNSDGDYNDVTFQLLGAENATSSMDDLFNLNRDWRSTTVGQDLLAHADNNYDLYSNGLLSLPSPSNESSSNPEPTTTEPQQIISGYDLNFKSFFESLLSTENLITEAVKKYAKRSLVRTDESVIGSEVKIASDRGQTLYGKENYLNSLIGRRGIDKLYGNRNDDMLFGEEGDDLLFGGRGQDVLNGGLGKNQLIGGRDSDLFVIGYDEEIDTIRDFEVGIDLINLANGLDFDNIKITQGIGRAKNDSLLQTEDGNVFAILKNVNPEELSSTDFM